MNVPLYLYLHYNVIRGVMARAAEAHDQGPRELSVKGRCRR